MDSNFSSRNVDFTNKIVKNTIIVEKKENLLKGIVKYDTLTGRFYVRLSTNEKYIIGNTEITNCDFVYTLPNNNILETWRKMKNYKGYSTNYYGKYYDLQPVKGVIVDNEFIVKDE